MERLRLLSDRIGFYDLTLTATFAVLGLARFGTIAGAPNDDAGSGMKSLLSAKSAFFANPSRAKVEPLADVLNEVIVAEGRI